MAGQKCVFLAFHMSNSTAIQFPILSHHHHAHPTICAFSPYATYFKRDLKDSSLSDVLASDPHGVRPTAFDIGRCSGRRSYYYVFAVLLESLEEDI